jgi:hypothetical protein
VNDEHGVSWKVGLAYEKPAKLFGVNGAEINVFFAAPPMYRRPPKHTRRKVAQLIHVNALECISTEILARLVPTNRRRVLEHGLKTEVALPSEPILRDPLLTVPAESLFAFSAQEMRPHLSGCAKVLALIDEHEVRVTGIQVSVHCGGKKVASLKRLRG